MPSTDPVLIVITNLQMIQQWANEIREHFKGFYVMAIEATEV